MLFDDILDAEIEAVTMTTNEGWTNTARHRSIRATGISDYSDYIIHRHSEGGKNEPLKFEGLICIQTILILHGRDCKQHFVVAQLVVRMTGPKYGYVWSGAHSPTVQNKGKPIREF